MKPYQEVYADTMGLGNGVSYLHWVVAEVAVSVVSISVPSISHLIQRAREYGLSALFTSREAVASEGSYLKSGASSGLAHQKEGFRRFRKDGTFHCHLSMMNLSLIEGARTASVPRLHKSLGRETLLHVKCTCITILTGLETIDGLQSDIVCASRVDWSSFRPMNNNLKLWMLNLLCH